MKLEQESSDEQFALFENDAVYIYMIYLMIKVVFFQNQALRNRVNVEIVSHSLLNIGTFEVQTLKNFSKWAPRIKLYKKMMRTPVSIFFTEIQKWV